MSTPPTTPGRPVPGTPPEGHPGASGGDGAVGGGGTAAAFDPLRLCIFATVALLAWVFGPFAVLVFALLGFAGYVRARRAGLTRSRCYLRDVRLVLLYLGVLAVAAVAGCVLTVARFL